MLILLTNKTVCLIQKKNTHVKHKKMYASWHFKKEKYNLGTGMVCVHYPYIVYRHRYVPVTWCVHFLHIQY